MRHRSVVGLKTLAVVYWGVVLGAGAASGGWLVHTLVSGHDAPAAKTSASASGWIAASGVLNLQSYSGDWGTCARAVTADRTSRLVVCARQGVYRCWLPSGQSDDPKRWLPATDAGNCRAARDELVRAGYLPHPVTG